MVYQEMIDFGYNVYIEYFDRNKDRANGRNKMEWLRRYNEGLVRIIEEKEQLEKLVQGIPNNESKYLNDFRRAVNEYFSTAKEEKEKWMELPLPVAIGTLLKYFDGIREFMENEKETRKYTIKPKTVDLSKEEMGENPAELY